MLRKYIGGGEEKMDKQKKAQAAETLRTAMMALSGYVFLLLMFIKKHSL